MQLVLTSAATLPPPPHLSVHLVKVLIAFGGVAPLSVGAWDLLQQDAWLKNFADDVGEILEPRFCFSNFQASQLRGAIPPEQWAP